MPERIDKNKHNDKDPQNTMNDIEQSYLCKIDRKLFEKSHKSINYQNIYQLYTEIYHHKFILLVNPITQYLKPTLIIYSFKTINQHIKNIREHDFLEILALT